MLRRITISDIADQFRKDRTRWFLWFPAFIGLGIALYFCLSWQPGPVWLIFPCLLTVALIALRDRQQLALTITLTGALLVSIGFSASIFRTYVVAAPVLQKKMVTVVTGTVLEKSAGYKSARLLLGDLDFPSREKMPLLERIRLSSRSNIDAVKPGQIVNVKAVLLPPPEPAYPGGYDFQRQSYYQSVGAVGYSIGKFRITGQSDGLVSYLKGLSAGARANIADFVLAHAPPENAGFIIAILTGDKAAIPPDQLDNMRDSGLAHLLAISGLHMGMIGGLIFFSVRLLLVLSPYVALHYPIKKVAAIVALAGLGGYLFVSGMSVSAVRAYIMISAFFVAVCFDRTALSLRMVALAAVVILVLFPESLTSASFQMSFAAVFALISLYEMIGPSLSRLARSGGIIRRMAAYALGVIMTSLVAGLATAPFALYHFGQVAVYSVVANLLAVPIMGLWIMPGAILMFLGYPFGLSAPLHLMGGGIDLILWIAGKAASWPQAVLYLGSFPVLQLTAITVVGLWFIIWRQPIRWAALPVMAMLLVSFGFRHIPDILISGSGNLYAIRNEAGHVYFSSKRIEKFEAERWRLVMGEETIARKQLPLSCDPYGCVYRRAHSLIAFSQNLQAVEADCVRADMIVSRVPVSRKCAGAKLVIDKFDLWRGGAHSLYFDQSGNVTVETANGLRGDRPWVPLRYRETLSRLADRQKNRRQLVFAE
ncbi:MAG: ComEC family competence protein [Sneathiella sp.]|nr:ComEC family competence protein [Sneathiella sp.]